MASSFKLGERVTILFFAGRILDAVIERDTGETVLLCSTDEFERAHVEGRVPASVEYPKDYVRSYGLLASTATLVDAAATQT